MCSKEARDLWAALSPSSVNNLYVRNAFSSFTTPFTRFRLATLTSAHDLIPLP